MSSTSRHPIERWTSATAVENYKNQPATEITVNDRAATRHAIIARVRQHELEFIERSHWAAHRNRSANMRDDWNYEAIAVHTAGRSHACGPAALQLQAIQDMQMGTKDSPKDDIAYHYALDCFGNVYEGRDIRFKGEHLYQFNTGAIGIVLLENLIESSETDDVVGKALRFLGKLGYRRQPMAPEAQQHALLHLISILREVFPIKTLGGHREFPRQAKGDGRVCPGNVGIALVERVRIATGLAMPETD
ncbi:N-acetylmuramoyl-L-alanine amidase [Oxalobacteraceae bacterium OM1]|nr:N-acetylmuramoyl-L-alanine amidase [Oxalobacteraceae bacterium OM1]